MKRISYEVESIGGEYRSGTVYAESVQEAERLGLIPKEGWRVLSLRVEEG